MMFVIELMDKMIYLVKNYYLKNYCFELLENVHVCNFWVGRVFASGPGDPRLSHTNESKMVLDASLLNTQPNKVSIKGKVE